jgi:ubiquinone biosynthesis protein
MLHASPRAFITHPKAAAAQATQRSLDVLGGGFVKIAQIIAHSPALFPRSLVKACEKSLCRATTLPTSHAEIECMVKKEFDVSSLREIFETFESDPIAAASIAQVHRARLRTGEDCVVKVVRPKVKERLLADFQALLLLARLADLVLGDEVVRLFVNRPLESCIGELHRAVMAECDLSVERQNMKTFGNWVYNSPSLRRMGLESSVVIPKTYEHASGERILTMDYVRGPTLAELSDHIEIDPNRWQSALVKALTVAAVSIIDDAALFHADLHSGNMIMVMGPSNTYDKVAFIDFGCCGQLPSALRTCLLMQGSAFADIQPNVRQFTDGFAHALDRLPGLGQVLDPEGLATELRPLLLEIQRKNPFQPGADPMDPELHMLGFQLQCILCRHGVQLPAEFTLLMKTACFGALYFSLLDTAHREQLLKSLFCSGAAHALCNPREAVTSLSSRTLLSLAKILWAKKKGDMVPSAKVVACATSASLPLIVLAMQYLQ